jgi:hypothetical protein
VPLSHWHEALGQAVAPLSLWANQSHCGEIAAEASDAGEDRAATNGRVCADVEIW